MKNPNSTWSFLFFPMMVGLLAVTLYFIYLKNPQLMAQDSLYEFLKKKRGEEGTVMKPPMPPLSDEAFNASAIPFANLQRTSQLSEKLRPSHRLIRFGETVLDDYSEENMRIQFDAQGIYVNDATKMTVLSLAGEVKWTFQLPEGKKLANGPLAVGENVLVAATDKGIVYAFEKTTGRIVWYLNTKHIYFRQPILAQKDLLLFAYHSKENKWQMVLADPKTGEIRKSHGPLDLPLSGEVALNPSGQLAYFATENSHVYALRLTDGDVLWKNESVSPLNGTVAFSGDRVYAVNRDGILFSYDAKSGREIWETDLEGEFASPVAVLPEGSALYVMDKRGYLYALNLRTGKREWRYNFHQSYLNEWMLMRMRGSSFADIKVEPKTRFWTIWSYCGSSRICILEPHEGQLLYRVELGGQPLALPYFDSEGEDMMVALTEGDGDKKVIKLVHFMDSKKARAIREAQKNSPLAPLEKAPGQASTSTNPPLHAFPGVIVPATSNPAGGG